MFADARWITLVILASISIAAPRSPVSLGDVVYRTVCMSVTVSRAILVESVRSMTLVPAPRVVMAACVWTPQIPSTSVSASLASTAHSVSCLMHVRVTRAVVAAVNRRQTRPASLVCVPRACLARPVKARTLAPETRVRTMEPASPLMVPASGVYVLPVMAALTVRTSTHVFLTLAIAAPHVVIAAGMLSYVNVLPVVKATRVRPASHVTAKWKIVLTWELAWRTLTAAPTASVHLVLPGIDVRSSILVTPSDLASTMGPVRSWRSADMNAIVLQGSLVSAVNTTPPVGRTSARTTARVYRPRMETRVNVAQDSRVSRDLVFLYYKYIQHIEAETKWPPFSRRYFQMLVLKWTYLNFDLDFT